MRMAITIIDKDDDGHASSRCLPDPTTDATQYPIGEASITLIPQPWFQVPTARDSAAEVP